MLTCTGFSAEAADRPLARTVFQRRDTGPRDVRIDIQYCGVCHSDLHTARNEWHNTVYPCIPGHEIVGVVADAGAEVTKFRVGDTVGVGCMVGSCGRCGSCRDGLEQYCETGFNPTYNGQDPVIGGPTFGGYADSIVVDESFVLRIPDGLDPAAAAPLLCAGITTYSPLRHWKAGPGQIVGVVGLGGLGHMGVKLARAMGAHVVLFTTSPGKKEDALRLGAHEVVVSRNAEDMAQQANRFDLILDCVAAQHPIDDYLALLKRDGTLVQVGAPEHPLPVAVFSLIFKRRNFAGSLIGGIPETQEMLDFCASRGIAADIEMIRIQDINTAYERMLRSDVKYRFVIDMASLREA
ncbi:NAD(P)-dependent alcohol dehydrogenase [Granulibacter bethesdensis]|uniref:NAD(P)-dependent alcohol dehydrogenase n=1 Tax=Granulibacter bethesdensis TaxID=364410 RepID=UPI0003F20C73|nr:NAD(P)-dependent alcohol dehydrogenase [Granulibacter bethesdensis]AHJ66880.1 Alcohol dehydrogenase [NADP+] [Granulibacter bethesdensis CGDNIH4]